jgi:hypothetical protein
MKKHLLKKLHPNSTGYARYRFFRILKNPTEKVMMLLRSGGKKIKKLKKVSNGAPVHSAPLLFSRLQNSKKFKNSNGAPHLGAPLVTEK